MFENFYEILKLPFNATPEEIKKAYRKLALVYHPDRGGDIKKFQEILNAYQVLNNMPQQQGPTGPFFDYDAFDLPRATDLLDHYEYLNDLLRLRGRFIRPGKVFDVTHYNRLKHVASKLYRGHESVLRLSSSEILKHKKKIAYIENTFFCEEFSPGKRKLLYDLSLSYSGTDKEKAIVKALGGREVNWSGFQKTAPHPRFANSVFVLYDAGILTPANYQKLIQYNIEMAMHLDAMRRADLLTQDNFDFLLKYLTPQATKESGFLQGIILLSKEGILTQKNFKLLFARGQGYDTAKALCALHSFDLVVDETEKVAVYKIANNKHWELLGERLHQLEQQNKLSLSLRNILHWKAPEPFSQLEAQLHHLVAHGLWLLTDKPELGEVAILLALDLKQELKQFLDLPVAEQERTQVAFRREFIEKLHFPDTIMSVHRAYWKILLANILIAFSGVGLFALGVKYALTQKGFFAKTHREQCVEQLERNFLKGMQST